MLGKVLPAQLLFGEIPFTQLMVWKVFHAKLLPGKQENCPPPNRALCSHTTVYIWLGSNRPDMACVVVLHPHAANRSR